MFYIIRLPCAVECSATGRDGLIRFRPASATAAAVPTFSVGGWGSKGLPRCSASGFTGWDPRGEEALSG